MNTRLASFALLAFAIATTVSAVAGTVYENGPINGNVDAWDITEGFVVSNSFTVSDGPAAIDGLSFGAWLTPGDTLQSVEVSLTSQVQGGTIYFDGVVNVTQSGCTLNQFSYDVCTETGSFNGPQLDNGTYWLNLQNGVDTNGDPVYWDENSGIGCHSPGCPSQGALSPTGSIPSEAFTILGNGSGTGTVPEPSSLVLVASGFLGLAATLRRKLY
jgi:hypothetical protein